jgi:hypothetical protein
MGCQVEIVAEEYDNCIYVPIQTVMSVGGQSTVYIYDNGKTIPRPVEIGLDNNRMVRVISGLRAGEQVMMNPPLAEAEVKKGSGRKNKSKPGGGKPKGKSARQKAGEPGSNKMSGPKAGGMKKDRLNK